MDDRFAISRIKQGDLSALEILVNRYQARAVHAAYLVLYDREQAEDIVQTAFLKVVEHIEQFEQERPFGPWFFRIVVNDAIKTAKRQNRSISLDEQPDEASVRLAGWLVDDSPGPEHLLQANELRWHLLQAIEYLAPEQRAVVVMRYFLEMSEAELTITMKRPLSTIKWWLREARKRLRNRINEYLLRGANYE